MNFLEMILTAAGLGADAFAVSMAARASGLARGRRAAFRLSFHFGLFQFLMPIVGWALGSRIVGYLDRVDHWVAFALLAVVGAHMIRGALAGSGASWESDPSRGVRLVTLSLATSIDALAVGISLGVMHAGIWYPSVTIGLITAAMSLVGLHLGRTLGARFGTRMELVGGIVLILIGLRILVAGLVGG